MTQEQALRVALIWNGTMMQEKTLRLPSENERVTIGEERNNTFVLSGAAVPHHHPLFRRDGASYALDLVDSMTGTLHVGGEESAVADRIGDYLRVGPGDMGVIHYHSVTFYFQFVGTCQRLVGRKHLAGFGGTLTQTIWFSLLA